MNRFYCLALCLVLTACGGAKPVAAPYRWQQLQHIVVIYAENRSFDHLYGLFPGAHGIAHAGGSVQLDHDGTPFAELPPIWADKNGLRPTLRLGLPNRPFRLDLPPLSWPLSAPTPDLTHRFYQNIEQINGGANNRFAAISDGGGLAMGHYDGSQLPMWRWARDYVLADHFFMAAYGGSFLNHQWLVCACTPTFADAPAHLRAQLDGAGRLRRKPGSPALARMGPPQFYDGAVSPDGHVVNTLQPPYQPSGAPPADHGDPRLADPARHPLPPLTAPTIGDALSAKGIGWAWYAEGWRQASTDGQQPAAHQRRVIYNEAPGAVNFQPHHQPFNYYARFAPGSPDRDLHLKDGDAFLRDLADGTLPPVAFYKPAGRFNQHPGYTDVLSGDQHIHALVERIKSSPLWPGVAIIVTYDENGGFWDHMPPPAGDRFGPGNRVPAIIISPLAKRGFVDHTPYDTTSIIKFISRRFGLSPLPGLRPAMGDLANAFLFAD